MYEIYKNYFGYIFLALECDDDIIFNSKMQDDVEQRKEKKKHFVITSLLSP